MLWLCCSLVSCGTLNSGNTGCFWLLPVLGIPFLPPDHLTLNMGGEAPNRIATWCAVPRSIALGALPLSERKQGRNGWGMGGKREEGKLWLGYNIYERDKNSREQRLTPNQKCMKVERKGWAMQCTPQHRPPAWLQAHSPYASLLRLLRASVYVEGATKLSRGTLSFLSMATYRQTFQYSHPGDSSVSCDFHKYWVLGLGVVTIYSAVLPGLS